jgi:hypothetical protein
MICAICDRAALNCELTLDAGWVCPSCLDNSDLRAGITRAENDLAEARQVARRLKALMEFIDGRDYDKFCEARALGVAHPWLTEAD